MKVLFSALMLFLAGGLTAQEKIALVPLELDLPPEVALPIPNIEANNDAEDISINLNVHFSDPNDPEATLTYEISTVSDPSVAEAVIANEVLHIDFLNAGQTNVFITASNNGLSCADTFVIGVRPPIEGKSVTSTFDDLELEKDTYWNGSDESGGYISGNAYFSNTYTPEYYSWTGWAYSNTTDNTTPGYMNQYSVFSAIRLDSMQGKNYGVTFVSPSSEIRTADNLDHVFNGFFITNSTYTTLAMKNGDLYTKKFGGEDGSDPDWLDLGITGYNLAGDSVGTIKYKLADFSFPDNSKDYIIETWQWLDLSSLGEIHKLVFSMSSTDVGEWGMNTPAYFCMDNLQIAYLTSIDNKERNHMLIYPNPSSGSFRITSDNDEEMNLHIYNINGREVASFNAYSPGEQINIENHAPGAYILKIETVSETKFQRLIIQ